MQYSDAKQLKILWGDKPCSHSKIEKECDLGADTGDYVCITCGKEFSKEEKMIIEQAHGNK